MYYSEVIEQSKSFGDIFRDLLLVLKEFRHLPAIAVDNEDDKPIFYGEPLYVKLPTLVDFGLELMIYEKNYKNMTNLPQVPVNVVPSDDGAYWFYVNGMATHETGVELQKHAIQELFGCELNCFYSPTHGFYRDILECMAGRTLGNVEEMSVRFAIEILSKLATRQKCILIAHSHGGIVASNIVKVLGESESTRHLLSNLEVYTFAGAFYGFERPNPLMHIEHFANEYDFVAKIGVLSNKKDVDGRVFLRKNATGHLLNRHYLGAFQRGAYCNKRSRLYSYIKTI